MNSTGSNRSDHAPETQISPADHDEGSAGGKMEPTKLYELDTTDNVAFMDKTFESFQTLFANSTAFYVVVYILIGCTLGLIFLYGVRLIRSRMRSGRSRRRISVRTSGVRSQRDLVELRRLERSEEDDEEEADNADDDVTLFSKSKPSSLKSIKVAVRGGAKRK